MKERTLFLKDKNGFITEVFLKGEPNIVDIVAMKVYDIYGLDVNQDSDQN